jgi:hypothetical protein
MKISKFFFLAVSITVFLLLYVYQQSEIFRLGYGVDKRQESLQGLLDTNALLRYTVQKNASLTRIGDKLTSRADFQMPQEYRLVKVSYPAKGKQAQARLAKTDNIFARIFSVKRQAEAKTIDR